MAATTARCALNRLFTLHSGGMFDNVVTSVRHNTWHHIRHFKSQQTSHKGWLSRLTGLGTGLSLCAKPAIVPAEDIKAKLLDIDPSSLTHSSLIRNASTVAVDGASALVSQCVIAAIELNQQYVKYVNELISLYESHIINMGVPAEEGIWQEVIEVRVKAEDSKRAAEEVESILEAALHVLEYAGEAAYQAGCEVASITAGQRVTLAQSQLEVAKTISQNALQELTKIQEMSIVQTAKHAEKVSKMAEQESDQGQEQPSVMAAT